jgi:chromatin remodeling complex protein RSC6
MTFNEKIEARLRPPTEPDPKKIISVRLSSEQIAAMEKIAEAMTRLSGKSVSRNDLILDAVDSFIENAGQVLAQHEQGETPQDEQARDEQAQDEQTRDEQKPDAREQDAQPEMGFGLGQTM